MDTILKSGGKPVTATASNASRNPKPDTSNARRMLTPSEIASLRQKKQADNRYMKTVAL